MLEDKIKEVYEKKFMKRSLSPSCDNDGDVTTIDEGNFYLQHAITKKMQYNQQPIMIYHINEKK